MGKMKQAGWPDKKFIIKRWCTTSLTTPPSIHIAPLVSEIAHLFPQSRERIVETQMQQDISNTQLDVDFLGGSPMRSIFNTLDDC